MEGKLLVSVDMRLFDAGAIYNELRRAALYRALCSINFPVALLLFVAPFVLQADVLARLLMLFASFISTFMGVTGVISINGVIESLRKDYRIASRIASCKIVVPHTEDFLFGASIWAAKNQVEVNYAVFANHVNLSFRNIDDKVAFRLALL
jgi:hypothetical protein